MKTKQSDFEKHYKNTVSFDKASVKQLIDFYVKQEIAKVLEEIGRIQFYDLASGYTDLNSADAMDILTKDLIAKIAQLRKEYGIEGKE